MLHSVSTSYKWKLT